MRMSQVCDADNQGKLVEFSVAGHSQVPSRRSDGREGHDEARPRVESAGIAAHPSYFSIPRGIDLPLSLALSPQAGRGNQKRDQGAYTFMSRGEEHISDPVPSPPSAGERAREKGRSMPRGMENS